MTLSQWLTVIGLAFELVSVLITVRKLFYGYYKRLKKGTFRQEIKKDRNEGNISGNCSFSLKLVNEE